MASSRKLSIIDVINEYLSQGQKPPPALLAKAAEQEALQRPPAALDPVQLAAGAYAFGPLSEAANEAIGVGAQYGSEGAQALGRLARGKAGSMVPQLIQRAPEGVSSQTRPLSGTMGETQPLLPKGVKMPGGGVAAKGTGLLADDKLPAGPTEPLSATDLAQMQQNGILPPSGLGEFGQTGTTGPLAPQAGGITAGFGEPKKLSEIHPELLGGKGNIAKLITENPNNPAIKNILDNALKGSVWNASVQPPTEKLTPFEAWQNIQPPKASIQDTHELPGVGLYPEDPSIGAARKTGSLSNSLDPNDTTVPKTTSLEPQDIEEMASVERPKTEDLVELLKQNLSPADTRLLPENALYHGLSVFHSGRAPQLAGIAQEGMKGGWFSEEPHQPFGPHFIATRPEDLPPLLVRQKQFNIDPEKEIIPRWKKMSTENLETAMKMRGKSPRFELTPEIVKGRKAVRSAWPNIHQLVGADEAGGGTPLKSGGHVVPPEKLFLTDPKGDIIGRMAPKGGKSNAMSQMMERAKAFKNVLERGTSTVDNVFQQLWGEDPELTNATKAQKIVKLKQFLNSEPKDNAMHNIWAKFAGSVKQALKQAKLPDWIIENKASEDDVMDAIIKAGEDIPK